MMTRQGEIRQDHVRQLCLQAYGPNIIVTACVHPRSQIPYKQKWSITVVR